MIGILIVYVKTYEAWMVQTGHFRWPRKLPETIDTLPCSTFPGDLKR